MKRALKHGAGDSYPVEEEKEMLTAKEARSLVDNYRKEIRPEEVHRQVANITSSIAALARRGKTSIVLHPGTYYEETIPNLKKLGFTIMNYSDSSVEVRW